MAVAQIQSLDPQNLVTYPVEFGTHRLAISNFAHDETLNDYIRQHRVYEPWQMNLMSRVLKPDAVCIDVGANVGINAMFAGLLCPRGRVYAYEPLDAINQVLRHNIKQNGLTNVVAVGKGLSDAAAAMEMAADRTKTCNTHISVPEDAQWGFIINTAHFARLDDEVRRLGLNRLDFVKIDVEGHELQVLAGGQRTLSDPDLQVIIEYNVSGHLYSHRADGGFADVKLFDALRALFRHIFYISREQGLLEIKDWHQLRRRLMGGYCVDDLYCVNKIAPEVQDLIIEGPQVQPQVHVTRETHGSLSIAYYNRDPDGWAMVEPFNPSTVSMTIEGPPQALSLKFDRMYRQHLPDSASLSSWPVYVMVGSEQHRMDLLDQPAELYIQMTGPKLDITLQSEHHTTAAQYLGNPGDPRQIGFRFVPVL
jgi:FkbM family methyltransferase